MIITAEQAADIRKRCEAANTARRLLFINPDQKYDVNELRAELEAIKRLGELREFWPMGKGRLLTDLLNDASTEEKLALGLMS